MNRRHRNYIVLTLCAFFVAVGYANCAPAFKAQLGEVSGDFASSGSPICDQNLMAAFNTTYRPVVTDPTLCFSCHTEGGKSPYKFASSNLLTGFNTFKQVGVNAVDANAISTTHAPPITGPQNQARFEAARNAWDLAYGTYQACIGTGGTAEDVLTGDLVLNAKNEQLIYYGETGTYRTIRWALGSEALPVGSRLAAYFDVDVRVNYQLIDGKKIATGYVFGSPRVSMLTGEIELSIDGLAVGINGKVPAGAESFTTAKALARGVDPTKIYDGELFIPMDNVSTSDKLSFAFTNMVKRARSDNPVQPAAATVTVTGGLGYVMNTKVPLVITNDTTIRRWCVTTSATRPTSTGSVCPGYENAISSTGGWVWADPANGNKPPTVIDIALTLGRAPNQSETVPIYVWVANNDLKISATAGQTQVVYDVMKPATPTFTSIQEGTTQIADINGLSDSSEPVTWCIVVRNSMQKADQANCDPTGPKPTIVPLPYASLNYVKIIVKDRAGNLATPTTTIAVPNTHGAISYTQLIGGTPSGIIAARCFACHGAGGSQQSKFDATNYADQSIGAYVKRSNISTRVSNGTMPPTGPLPQKEIELLKLWVNSGAVQ
jgi:cytochrome c553